MTSPGCARGLSFRNLGTANGDARRCGCVTVYLSHSAAWLVMATTLIPAALAATTSSINQFCPVMPEEKVDSRYTLEFEGRTIGFCCEKCVEKFQANPDRYRARLPQLVNRSVYSALDSTIIGQQIDASRVGTATSWTEMLGRYHPVVVHLPLAGLPLAFLGLCVWVMTKNPAFAAADVPPLLVAGAVSIVAVVTGNMAEGSTVFGPNLQGYLKWHEYVGTTLMALTLALCGIRIWRWRRMAGAWLRLYAGGLLVASLLAGVAGFLGGTLVFGEGHLWS